MNKQYRIKRICLVCNHSDVTYETKGEPKDIVPCPKCNGSFVDVWLKGKYAVNNKMPLLTFELQDMNSVPIVKYKGEEIKLKTHVAFDWKGRTEESYGGAEFEIEHHLREGEGIGHFNTIKKVSTFKG